MDMTTTLPPDYKPTAKEKFMNAKQKEYFRQRLLKWRSELLGDANETRQNLQETSILEPDVADRGEIAHRDAAAGFGLAAAVDEGYGFA